MKRNQQQEKISANTASNAHEAIPPTEIHTRPQVERLVELKRLVLAGTYLTTRQLAEKLEVSIPTVSRDVQFMRERLDMPIEFDEAKQGYHFTGPVGPLPGEKPSDSDVNGAIIAIKVLERFGGMTWHKPIENILQQWIAQGNGQQKARSKKLRPAVYFQQPDVPEPTDPNLFELMMTAVWQDQAVRFEYCKPLDIYRVRMIDPYVLTAFEGSWYLLGRDRVSNKMRLFKLCRMRNPQMMSQKFTMPADFDVEEHYDKSLGVMISDGDFEVEVELSAWLTAILDERRGRAWRSWTKLKDGRSIVRMQLSCLEEVQRWVLGWGKQVKVRKPKALRNFVRDTSAAVTAMYDDSMEPGATGTEQKANSKAEAPKS